MQSSVTHKSHPQPHFSLHQILHSLRLLHFIMSGTQIEAIYPSSYPENLCERCRGINAESRQVSLQERFLTTIRYCGRRNALSAGSLSVLLSHIPEAVACLCSTAMGALGRGFCAEVYQQVFFFPFARGGEMNMVTWRIHLGILACL